jgi:hypothetical protein
MHDGRGSDAAIDAAVGYAADERGNGIAYVSAVKSETRRLLRIAFRVAAPVSERAVGYAALTAVARALAKRGVRGVRFVLSDREFAQEVATGSGVSDTFAIPYVRLRCALNALSRFEVRVSSTDDLTQRARAEAALNVAA